MSVDQFSAFDLMTADAWRLVVAHIEPRNRRNVALVSRDMRDVVRGMSLQDDFEYATTHEFQMDVALLACARPNPHVMLDLLGRPRTGAVHSDWTQVFWTAVLRRLVIRQPFLKPGSLLYIDPGSDQWTTIVQEMTCRGPYASIAPCTFITACHVGIKAIVDHCCGQGRWTGVPCDEETLALTSRCARAGGGIEIAKSLDGCAGMDSRAATARPNALMTIHHWIVDMIVSRNPRRPQPSEIDLMFGKHALYEAAISAGMIGDLQYFLRCLSLFDVAEFNRIASYMLHRIAPFGFHEVTDFLLRRFSRLYPPPLGMQITEILFASVRTGDARVLGLVYSIYPNRVTVDVSDNADSLLGFAIESHNPACVRFVHAHGVAGLRDKPAAPECVGLGDQMMAAMAAIRRRYFELNPSAMAD